MATLIGSIFVFVLVILLHELGHFAVAKKVGIKVNEFSIGMGPGIYKKQKGETLYSLRALPVGGYVAMEGEEEDSQDPRSFNNAPVKSRIAVVLAGAGMNFILAIVAFFLAFMVMGMPSTTIGSVEPGSPAEKAGIQPGDRVIAVEDQAIDQWAQVPARISESTGPVELSLEREGQDLALIMEPKEVDGRMMVGIGSKPVRSLPQALKQAFIMTGAVIASIFHLFKMIFSGNFSVSMLSGPVGVVQFIGQSTKNGLGQLLYTLGFISANLGLVNLLPIPALDGGKFVFLVIEGVRGKPVSEKIETGLSLAGITLLFGLMFYVTIFGDLARIFG